MINTFQTNDGHVTKFVDGKEIRIPIPPQLHLQLQGPIINVTITQPTSISEKLLREGQSVEAISVKALIDTGASCCIVTKQIVERLKLIQTGFCKIASVNEQQDRPTYIARINTPWGKGKDVAVAECPLPGFDCIIGRDIMQYWNIIYNGKDGFFTICD